MRNLIVGLKLVSSPCEALIDALIDITGSLLLNMLNKGI